MEPRCPGQLPDPERCPSYGSEAYYPWPDVDPNSQPVETGRACARCGAIDPRVERLSSAQLLSALDPGTDATEAEGARKR